MQPALHLEGVDVVVIADALTFEGAAVGVVEVVLHDVRVGLGVVDVAVGETVDIEPELTAEQVAHRGVVAGLGVVEVDSRLQGHVVVETLVEGGSGNEVKLV